MESSTLQTAPPPRPPVWRLTGIQRALLLYVVLPILAVIGIGLGVGLERMNSQETERLKSDLELLGRAIRLPVQEALMAGDFEAVERALDSVFDIGRVYGASVYDINGTQVAAAGIASRDLTRSRVAQEVVVTGEQQDRVREISGVDMYSQFLPIFDALGQPNGFIQINRQASDFDASFRRLSLWAWTIWAVMAVLTITIVIFGHYRGLGRHMDSLKQTMNRVEAGYRESRAPEQGPSELADIARGLNQMLDSIERKDEALELSRQHEEEMAQRLQHQEQMAAIGRVASGIAHELGAPLTVIDGRARRLQKSTGDEEQLRQLNAIRGQVARLTRIVQQLLNYSRPGQLGDPAVFTHVKLETLLTGVLESVRHELPEEAPKLTLHAPEKSVPLIKGNEARLELALVNLVRNAAQAAEHHVDVAIEAIGVEPSLHERRQPELLIWVLDDGAGLPIDVDAKKLMEPFFTTKGQGEGTGLGLAIVDNVAREHGGFVQIRNRRDRQGCEVVMRLPIHLDVAS